jgi:hypothetical protein
MNVPDGDSMHERNVPRASLFSSLFLSDYREKSRKGERGIMEDESRSDIGPMPNDLRTLSAQRRHLLESMQQLVKQQRRLIDRLRNDPPALSRALREIGIEIDRVMREQDAVGVRIAAIMEGRVDRRIAGCGDEREWSRLNDRRPQPSAETAETLCQPQR